jgi:ribose 5-phosphate isomerase B
VSKGQSDCGILICGSGIGVSICANKVQGIRAALCHDELTAELSRRHNQANILCLASDVLGDEIIRRIVTCWLNTDAENSARHMRRIEKITMIEKGIDPREYQMPTEE